MTLVPNTTTLSLDIAKVSFGRRSRALLRFYLTLGLALLLIACRPGLALWLPRLLEGC